MRTDTKTSHRSNIEVKDYKRKTCLPSDKSVPIDILLYFLTDKLSKYKDLEMEI